MMLTMMLCLMTSMFLTLPKANNPLSMTLMIIFIALMTACSFSATLSSWYAFLVFLIYVGGMLVMFAYFTATSPNQQQMSGKKIMSTMLLTLLATSLFVIFSNSYIPLTPSKSHQLMSLYTAHNMYTLIMITLILLITMVIVVKLCSRTKGPLRTFMT